MKITFDPAKDASNVEKHGVPLALAVELDWDSLWSVPDHRTDSGELRMVGNAIAEDRLFCVVYTDRGELRRVISLRKANSREVKRYVANT